MKKRPFDGKEFFQKHTAGLVYYPADKAQKIMIESLEELNMEVPVGGLEYINKLYLNSPPSGLLVDQSVMEENGVKFIGYPEPIQIDLKPALESLTYGDMTPKPVEGLPVVSESGKIPKVYPMANRDTTMELYKVLEECDVVLTKSGPCLVSKEECPPLDVKKLSEELKKFLTDRGFKLGDIGSPTLPIIPLEGLEERNGSLYAIRKVESTSTIDHDLIDKMKKFRAENPDKVFELDSIPVEYRDQIRLEDLDLRPEDIGAIDNVAALFTKLPTLDEMMADMNKNGGFRRGELQVLFAKPRGLPPKSGYYFGANPLTGELNIVDFHMKLRPDHVWDQMLVDTGKHSGPGTLEERNHYMVNQSSRVDLRTDWDKLDEMDNNAVVSEIGLSTAGTEPVSYRLDELMNRPDEKKPKFENWNEGWGYEPGSIHAGVDSSMRYDRAITPSIGNVYKNLLEKDLIEKDFDKKKE